MNTYPPRPKWNHLAVKALAAKEIIDDVRDWASSGGVICGEDREFLALVTLALQETPDAYAAGRYIEDFIGWPTDANLVRILDRAFSRLKFLKTSLVHRWVVENGVRFPAKKGQAVCARIGDAELKVRITDVLKREAAAYGEFLGHPEKKIRVHAEEVLRVIPLGSSRGPGNNPTGGTPVVAKAAKAA